MCVCVVLLFRGLPSGSGMQFLYLEGGEKTLPQRKLVETKASKSKK